ncbi:hypothetical protein ACFLWS_03445 [Chloroflexota bacterium]
MLIVTENAKRHLKRLLLTNVSDPNFGIRLRVGKGMQLGVLVDRKADDDYVVEHEGAESTDDRSGAFLVGRRCDS